MSKILNPVVLIHKREDSDTYAVAITGGSQDYHDAVLMATMEPDMTGDNVDTWSKTGYYMAAEIESLRAKLEQVEERHLHLLSVVDDYDWQRQRLYAAAEKIIGWRRQEAKDRNGNPDNAESYACVRELRAAMEFCEKSGFTHAAEPAQSGDGVAVASVVDINPGKPLPAGASVSFTIDELSAMFSWMIPPYVVANTHTDEFNELRNKIFSALRDTRHRGAVDE
ncbi:hypothetical protein MMK47_004664 [Citrobacter koseri]|uniref:hypothetical protein n=1 Tax=Citrobacter koseri TaxID=545 RepID=UPI001F24E4DC|nr:hypothetical protein [Citrobacter koseri]